MANGKDTVPALKEPSADANPNIMKDIEEVKGFIDRLKGLLGELDAMGFSRPANYLSMAIDQVESNFESKSK